MPCMCSCTQVTCCTIVEMTSQPGSGFPMPSFTVFVVYSSGCVAEVCGLMSVCGLWCQDVCEESCRHCVCERSYYF